MIVIVLVVFSYADFCLYLTGVTWFELRNIIQRHFALFQLAKSGHTLYHIVSSISSKTPSASAAPDEWTGLDSEQKLQILVYSTLWFPFDYTLDLLGVQSNNGPLIKWELWGGFGSVHGEPSQ